MSEIASVRLPHSISNLFQQRDKEIIVHIDKVNGEASYKYKVEHGIFRVPPGRSVVSVRYAEYRNSSWDEAKVDLELELKAGRRYHPYANRQARKVNIWMVDAQSGQTVSDILTGEIYRFAALNPIHIDE